MDEGDVIEAILDSEASVAVIPPRMAAGHEMQESAASRAGVQYEVANGDEMRNLCGKLLGEGTVRGMRPQVAEVSKALLSVRAQVRTGQVVVVGGGENSADHYILNRETGEKDMVRDGGFDYLMRLTSFLLPLSCLLQGTLGIANAGNRKTA